MFCRHLAWSLPVLAIVSSFTSSASAHIVVTSPEPREPGNDDVKSSPCGPRLSWGDGAVLTYAPGEQVTVTWNETISHPGYFRVALGLTGDGALAMPSEEDFDSFTAYYSMGEMGTIPEPIENPAGQADGDMLIYYDYYAPHASRECAGTSAGGTCSYEVTVTLPQDCEQCTLQLIQTMSESVRSYGVNAHYYQCIDITIDGDMASPDPNEGAGGAGGDTGEEPNGEMEGNGAMPGDTPPEGMAEGGAPTMLPGEPGMGAMPGVIEPPIEPAPAEPPPANETPSSPMPTGTPGLPTMPDMAAPPVDPPPATTTPTQGTTSSAGTTSASPSPTTTTGDADTSSGGDEGGCAVARPGGVHRDAAVGWLLTLAGLAHVVRRRRDD